MTTWCWPKKGRVSRWERRLDSRPAVHFLAEEDEDEQVSRGLNHLVSRSAAGTQWTSKKVTVVVEVQERKRVRRTRRREHQEQWAADHVRQDP